ncbi:hypothetical protein ID866_7940 [Astraeus odoratus]|nr:hypothetical protein ID866_7940 [Astraeus odoratus]
MDRAVQEELSSRRPSSSNSRDRPARAPFGPRIRTRPKNSVDIVSPGASSSVDGSSPSTSALTSPTFASPHSRPASPTHDAPPYSLGASLLPPTVHYQPSVSSLQEEADNPSASSRMVEVAVQVPSSPPSPQPDPTRLTPQSVPMEPSITPKKPIGTFPTPSPLPSPSAINFESTPISWKGLPLEAAQWTFTSAELQDIVSRAIRLSAKESFIRLLSIQALDNDIVEEEKRLETERLTAQAQWRFAVGRRTMLMQALNSTAAVIASSGDGDEDNILGNLISQLATTIASCDAQMSAILHIVDQQTQISSIQQRHWSSALGVALRKLNKTCERQADDLKRALTKIQTLEDELEEAWKEAEAVAVELDAIQAEDVASEGRTESDDSSDGDADEHDDDDDDDAQALEDATMTADIGVVVGVTATAIASKATLLSPISMKYELDKSDSKSIKSTKSAKSAKSSRSKRSISQSRLSRVSAARMRSRTASNASLRLPRNLRTPTSSANLPPMPPPMPALPDNLQGHSFLDMGNVANEFVRPLRKWLPKRHPEPGAILPDVPRPEKSMLKGRIPSIRRGGADKLRSPQLSTFSPPITNDRLHSTIRRGNLNSYSGSDPGPVSPVLTHDKADPRIERPGSASGRLMHNDDSGRSFVSRASSVFRRLSQATSSKHYSASILPAYKVVEEDEESLPPGFAPD